MLKLIQKQLKNKTRAVYISTPGTSFLNIYQKVIEAIIREDYSSLQKTLPPHISNTVQSIPEEHSKYAHFWLKGNKLSYKIRNKLGIGSNLNPYEAIEILSNYLKNTDTVHAILLDEFEAILDLPTLPRQKYISQIRQLIDSATVNLCLIIATTPAGWTEVVEKHYALARRLAGTVLYLQSLNLEQAIELVNLYLGNTERKIFTKEAIREILQASQGNIGEFLRLAAITVDYAADRNAEKIDANLAKEALGDQL